MIAAISGRALASAARRAGYRPLVADFFCDTDTIALAERTRWFVRLAFPTAAVMLPLAFFLSVLDPDAAEPNAFVNLAYLGAVLLVAAMITLGVGLIRARAAVTSADGVADRR